jgi:hypothetical protein
MTSGMLWGYWLPLEQFCTSFYFDSDVMKHDWLQLSNNINQPYKNDDSYDRFRRIRPPLDQVNDA